MAGFRVFLALFFLIVLTGVPRADVCVDLLVSSGIRPYLEAADAFEKDASLPCNRIVMSEDVSSSHFTKLVETSACPYVVAFGFRAYEAVAAVRKKVKFYTMVLYPENPSSFACGLPLDLDCSTIMKAVIMVSKSANKLRLALLFSQERLEGYVNALVECISKKGYTASAIRLNPEDPLDDLVKVISDFDVFIAVPDEIFSVADLIYRICEILSTRNKPLIGFNPLFLKAGAIGALVVDPEKAGHETYRLFEHFLKTGECMRPPPPYELLIKGDKR